MFGDLFMPEYRRVYQPGGTFFFTVVTYQRRPHFSDAAAHRCLREAIASVRAKRPFETAAVVLLPNHLHAVWALPPGDADYSIRWRQIKEAFTRTCPFAIADRLDVSPSR